MKLRDLAYAGVRLLAVYIFLQGVDRIIQALQNALTVRFTGHEWTDIALIFTILAVTGILFICIESVLWINSNRFVRFILPSSHSTIEESDLKDNEWYVLGLTIVGIIVFVNALPQLIASTSQIIYYADHPFGGERLVREYALHIIGSGIKFFLSIALIFRARGIYALIKKLLDLGVKKDHTPS